MASQAKKDRKRYRPVYGEAIALAGDTLPAHDRCRSGDAPGTEIGYSCLALRESEPAPSTGEASGRRRLSRVWY